MQTVVKRRCVCTCARRRTLQHINIAGGTPKVAWPHCRNNSNKTQGVHTDISRVMEQNKNQWNSRRSGISAIPPFPPAIGFTYGTSEGQVRRKGTGETRRQHNATCKATLARPSPSQPRPVCLPDDRRNTCLLQHNLRHPHSVRFGVPVRAVRHWYRVVSPGVLCTWQDVNWHARRKCSCSNTLT